MSGLTPSGAKVERQLRASTAMAAALTLLRPSGFAGPARPSQPRQPLRAELHPTKGWRGPGTVSRGTNRRRRKL